VEPIACGSYRNGTDQGKREGKQSLICKYVCNTAGHDQQDTVVYLSVYTAMTHLNQNYSIVCTSDSKSHRDSRGDTYSDSGSNSESHSSSKYIV